MDSGRDLFIAIDTNAIIHRAFHAYPPTLTTTTGVQVNAVYGFTVMLLQLLKQFDPKYIVCAIDTEAPTFRHTQFTDYKAHRKPTDESLLAQFPLVEEVLKAFNIPVISREGFEADDVLGTFSQWVKEGKWSSYNLDLYLVTGDRDLLQLIGKNVYTCLPIGGFSNLVLFDRDKTLEKYGYAPDQVVDYKAIVGDASDNIPGVKGVGEKSALTLLKKYGTLDKIYENLKDLPEKQQKLLGEGVEQAEFSRELATIKTDVEFDLQLEQCLFRDFNENELVEVFKKFEFKSLLSKIPKSANGKISNGSQLGMFSAGGEGGAMTESDSNIEILNDRKFSDKLENAKLSVFGYISDDESEDGKEFVFGLVVDNSGEEFGYVDAEINCFTKWLNRETYFYGFEDWVSRIGGEINVDSINIDNIIDLRLFGHLLSSGKSSFDLSSLIFEYASKNSPEKLSQYSISRVLDLLPEVIEGMIKASEEVEITEYTGKWLEKVVGLVQPDIYFNILKKIENPVAVILAKMENRGIQLDFKVLNTLKDELSKRVSEVEQEIYKEVGHEFNVNSPKQLADVLYSEIGLPEGNGKGSRSTREEVLNKYVDAHPAVKLVLSYRELSKLLGTYVKPFIEMTSQMDRDGKECVIKTDFKQIGASSGRFSSMNPNMQNLPIRGDWGEKVRAMFVPRKGFKFVAADYSQIEFRVMADISEDPALLVDFSAGKDIHKATAARLLNKKIEDVTSEERALAKTVNFAILFGQSSYGLSQLLGIESKAAAEYIDEYFRQYKGVKQYIEKAKETALDKGYVQSMLGRTRYIMGLSSRNFNVKAAAVREAINMPIQGGEADIMKLAMIQIDKLIQEKYAEKAYMLLQIHDELIFEVKEKDVKNFEKDIAKIMRTVVELKVPLDVHTSSGDNMAELK